MNKSTIILDENQRRLLDDGKQVMLCTPLRDQPPKEAEEGYIADGKNYQYPSATRRGIYPLIRLQYPKDTVLGVRERCQPVYNRDGTVSSYLYKSGGHKLINPKNDGYRRGNPISSQTMPKDAIRTHVKVVDVRVKRAQDIDLDDLEDLGYSLDKYLPVSIKTSNYHEDAEAYAKAEQEFAKWFNAKYAKPRARRKNGEIVGYECWCWDFGSFFDLYRDDNNWGDTHEWKGKPLKIHVRPFVELTTLEVK